MDQTPLVMHSIWNACSTLKIIYSTKNVALEFGCMKEQGAQEIAGGNLFEQQGCSIHKLVVCVFINRKKLPFNSQSYNLRKFT